MTKTAKEATKNFLSFLIGFIHTSNEHLAYFYMPLRYHVFCQNKMLVSQRFSGSLKYLQEIGFRLSKRICPVNL